MRPLVTALFFAFSINAFGQLAVPSEVRLFIQKVSPTTFGYLVSVKIENTGPQTVSLPLTPTDPPIFQSLTVQQWDKEFGWQSVGRCLDLPPTTTRRLQAGETAEDVVPIGDASHGWGGTLCRPKLWRLGGKIRAALCIFDSDEQFRNRIKTPCRIVVSPTTQLPEALHLAHFERGPIKLVRPVYPDSAKKQGIQGTVVLDIKIREDGTVSDVAVVRGPEALIGVAIEAVRQWQYRPYILNGKAVPVESTITVKFVLPSTSPGEKRPLKPAHP